MVMQLLDEMWQRRLEADMMRFNAVMHARRGGVFLLYVLKKTSIILFQCAAFLFTRSS